jgi:undecaprenyl-diphosphatase
MPQTPDPGAMLQATTETVKQEVTNARQPWYHVSKTARVLLIVYAIQLALFAVLAWWVHANPVNSIDLSITREFQENPAGWLRTSMTVVSAFGLWYISTALIALAALIFWLVGLRLEAVFIVGLSLLSICLNALLKFLVQRPRPNGHMVDIFQAATGQSFPSGHVMAYLAFWGLLFSFGIILFRGLRWWRVLLLVIPALLVLLVGPSRIYLGDHWASDVLGSYLIGGVLLGLALYLYLQLKERGVLETKRIRERTEMSKVLRPFPRK